MKFFKKKSSKAMRVPKASVGMVAKANQYFSPKEQKEVSWRFRRFGSHAGKDGNAYLT